jgi:DNA-binding LytR/AlgR family response regulator
MAVKILVVEDESIVSKDIQQTLKKLGYQVVGSADNAEDAVKLATELKPDLVLMDIMIKGNKTGIDAAKEIKEKQDIPVIFLTAYADTDTIAKAKEAEPHGYIIKPYKEVDLHTSIEMVLYKHKKEQKIKEERDLLYSLVKYGVSEQDQNEEDRIIFIRSKSRQVKLNTKDIYFVEALKDYVTINTSDARYTIHSTMKDIERKLPQKHFIRVHRSYVVRIDKIKTIEQNNILLENNKKIIPIGASYKEALLEKINTF